MAEILFARQRFGAGPHRDRGRTVHRSLTQLDRTAV